MSIRIQQNVWKYTRARGNTLVVLLALSDLANDEGIAWPSVGYLARKARCSVRTVHAAIGELKHKLAELHVQEGAGPHRTNLYRVAVGVQDSQGATLAGVKHSTQTPATFDVEGVQDSHPIRKGHTKETLEPAHPAQGAGPLLDFDFCAYKQREIDEAFATLNCQLGDVDREFARHFVGLYRHGKAVGWPLVKIIEITKLHADPEECRIPERFVELRRRLCGHGPDDPPDRELLA